MAELTLPQFLLRNAKEHPRRVAMREKEYGIWQEFTWAQYLDHVKAIALGLIRLGFQRGDKIAIISDNRPQVYWTMVAAQACGGVPVPVYQDAIAKEIQYVIDHSDARFVLAEDQEQVDKLLELRKGLPKVQKIIYDDPKGMRHYRDPILMPLTELETLGQELDRAEPRRFEELVAAGRPDDVALISFTSGTTGFPKGAMVTHVNLIEAVRSALAVETYRPGDQYLAYLPPAWIGDSAWSLAGHLLAGFTVNYPERPETVQENLREIGPHIALLPPRILENLVSQIQVKMEDASRVKRWLFRKFAPVGQELARRRMERQPVSFGLQLLAWLGEFFVFASLRDHLGLRRARYTYTGGASLGPEVFLFFRGLGVNLKQVYGQTENSALSCIQRDGDVKLGTVGPPLPGNEIKITEDGEIISRSLRVFAGYYKDPEALAEVVRNGWLCSGDAGFFDPGGHLVVIDRLKDVTPLADGTKFAPQFICNKLKFSPYLKEGIAVGQDRPYVVVILCIDMENVGKWAERRQIAYTTYTDLAQKPQVYDLIQREVERVNRDLPETTRIRKFVLLHKELDPDDEEVTRTRKVRRGVVAQKYAAIIEALYTDAHVVPVTSVITYQDGRQATLETTLVIRDVAEVREPVVA